MIVRSALVVLLACGVGCSPAAPASDDEGGAGPSGAATAGQGGSISVGSGVGGAAGEPGLVAEVFGESADVLYRLDPDTKQVVEVGPFSGCSGVTDIAVDKDSNLYGTTDRGLFRIDRTTAACTSIAAGSYPNSLSFVPEGTIEPGAETLVGYLDAAYVRIDTATGDVTTIGGISGGLASSGDIVSVKGGKTLLTVTGDGCESDCIVEVDPITGDMIENHGQLPYAAVFGLAFWAGHAYGFSEGGELFEVSFDAGGVQTTPIAIPDAPPDLSFWGAGSTTSAPPDVQPK